MSALEAARDQASASDRAATVVVPLQDGTTVKVTTSGAGPVPVVVLAGGTAPSVGFFPGLASLRQARLVEHDRVGTGATPARPDGPPSLASAAADLHALREVLGLAPVVVLAQSFGGPVAVQWAVDYPQDVAGMVLLDPTPVDKGLATRIALGARVVGALDRPGPRALLDRLVHRALRRTVAEGAEAAAAGAVLAQEQWGRLARTVADYPAQADALSSRLAPRAGRVVRLIGADRKAGHTFRQIHERMAAELGGSYEVWDGASHAMHLQLPDRVCEVVQATVNQVASAAAAKADPGTVVGQGS
jgi:pimeloyl-ACP methyl ester carboxylesterase